LSLSLFVVVNYSCFGVKWFGMCDCIFFYLLKLLNHKTFNQWYTICFIDNS
jgi:hypothetical protein